MASCLFIAVNYGKPAETVLFCKHVRGLVGGAAAGMIIVDNSGSFRRPEWARLRRQLDQLEVTLFTPDENLGYFPGAAAALDDFLRGNALPDNVIVSNIDITFPDSMLLHRLGRLATDNDVMVVAPRIEIERRGVMVDQNPMSVSPYTPGRVRRLLRIFSNGFVYAAYEILVRAKRFRPRSVDQVEAGAIGVAHGSFMIFRKIYFEKTAGLHFPGFLYCEELFVAAEVERHGGRIIHAPVLKVRHAEGQTTGPLGWRRRLDYARHSLQLLWDRYYAT